MIKNMKEMKPSYIQFTRVLHALAEYITACIQKGNGELMLISQPPQKNTTGQHIKNRPPYQLFYRIRCEHLRCALKGVTGNAW